MLAALMADKVKLCHHLTKESRMSQHVLTGDKTASFPGTQRHFVAAQLILGTMIIKLHSCSQMGQVTVNLDHQTSTQELPEEL